MKIKDVVIVLVNVYFDGIKIRVKNQKVNFVVFLDLESSNNVILENFRVENLFKVDVLVRKKDDDLENVGVPEKVVQDLDNDILQIKNFKKHLNQDRIINTVGITFFENHVERYNYFVIEN